MWFKKKPELKPKEGEAAWYKEEIAACEQLLDDMKVGAFYGPTGPDVVEALNERIASHRKALSALTGRGLMYSVTIFNGFGDAGGNRLMTAKEALEFVEHPSVMISDYTIWDQRGQSIGLGKLRKEAKKEANAKRT